MYLYLLITVFDILIQLKNHGARTAVLNVVSFLLGIRNTHVRGLQQYLLPRLIHKQYSEMLKIYEK